MFVCYLGKEGISLQEENRTWEEILTKISINLHDKRQQDSWAEISVFGHFQVLGVLPPHNVASLPIESNGIGRPEGKFAHLSEGRNSFYFFFPLKEYPFSFFFPTLYHQG